MQCCHLGPEFPPNLATLAAQARNTEGEREGRGEGGDRREVRGGRWRGDRGVL